MLDNNKEEVTDSLFPMLSMRLIGNLSLKLLKG